MKQLRADPAYKVLQQEEVKLLKMQRGAAGEAKGLAKGEEIGLGKGKKEVAKRLLELWQPVDWVVKATGLGKAVVGKLQKAGK